MDLVLDRVRDSLLGGSADVSGGQRTTLDDALLLRAQDSAEKSAETALGASQAVGAVAAQQKSALDAATDRARLLHARGNDAEGSVARAREALERAKLVALNTGLEGSRLGEAKGRALVLVAEEVREIARMGLESLAELGGTLAQLDQERGALDHDLEAARQRAADLSQELLRIQAAQREAQVSVTELGRLLRSTTGSDPETARLLTQVADHARGLLGALSELSTKPQRGFVLRAVGPTLRPLLRLLRELDQRGRADEERA
jgi:hypothetical protein